jgi:hypothetical protein
MEGYLNELHFQLRGLTLTLPLDAVMIFWEVIKPQFPKEVIHCLLNGRDSIDLWS